MGGIREPLSINQEDPHDEKVCNPNYANFFLLPLRIFVDLIVGDVANLPSSSCPFCKFTLRR